MASWSRNQYRGNLGELEVARNFLNLGCVVNSLAASDAGWDLHIQVPEVAQTFAQLPESWRLSGRTAHVQVKQTSTDSVSINLDTLRGWVIGSKIGVPTFLVLVFEAKETLELKFVPPWLLDEKTGGNMNDATITEFVDEGAVSADDKPVTDAEADEIPRDKDCKKKGKPKRSFTKTSALGWDAETFGPLLQLWTKYPGFMFKAKMDLWTSDGLAMQKAEHLIAKICWAWAWAHREPSATDEDAFSKMMYIALPAAKTLEPNSSNNQPLAERLMEHVRHWQSSLIEYLTDKRNAAAAEGRLREAGLHQSQIDKSPWPQIEFATTYATSAAEGEAFAEALDLASDIAAYARYLDSLQART